MQGILDKLYWRSKHNITKGIDLLGIITSEANIMLAYRTIKSNKGSQTAGVDDKTIEDFKIKDKATFILEIRNRLEDFQPNGVRRVEILKKNGKKRPLGIPTMLDRIIGQMFLQVLTPICEAKFYDHSYGFRDNRSAHHAIQRCHHLITTAKCHYVIDVDVKSFFDEVNHTKLMSQLYTIGVKDRRVLAILSKMLKAEIEGEGIPSKGTPQGHIISPLLSNVVLNDLDQWIASQWMDFPSDHNYSSRGAKTRELKGKSKLKEMHIVRYCDDFKIFTRTASVALKIFQAVKGYLKNHLKLEISAEKSQVTNLRKRASEFLGIEIKAVKHKQGYKAVSNVSKSNKIRIREEIKERLKAIQKSPSKKNVAAYNSYVMGIHQYYSIATRVSSDFSAIAYSLRHLRYNRLNKIAKYGKPRSPPISYKKYYKNNYRTFQIGETYLYPLEDIKWKWTSNFNQGINNYTEEGRIKHEKLQPNITRQVQKMLNTCSPHRNIEYTDNRISKYSMQNGKCAVTGYFLEAEDIHCHHIQPKSQGGTDKFSNLVIIHTWVHMLTHATLEQTIDKYLRLLNLNEKQLEKLNKYREKCNLAKIYFTNKRTSWSAQCG